MAGILGTRKDFEEVKKLLQDGSAETFRDEWESGMSTEEIAKKHGFREKIVKRVISYDQINKSFEEL